MKKDKLAGIATITLMLVFAFFYKGCTEESVPKNLILMISDGAGFNHFYTQGYYSEGTKLPQVLSSMPVQLAVSTYPHPGEYDPEKAWTDSTWIKNPHTDSAAAATAMATGHKTRNGILGMTSRNEPLPNVTEAAKEAGKRAGVVTTVMFSHATPAGFVVHKPARSRYSEIAHEMLASEMDLIFGCGYPTRGKCKYVGGDAVWNSLQKGDTSFNIDGDGKTDFHAGDNDGDGKHDAWYMIHDLKDFEAIEHFNMMIAKGYQESREEKDPDHFQPVGLSEGRILGVPRCYHTLQQERPGDGKALPYKVPMQDSLPDLSLLSRAALQALSDDPDGFFLMIEGGAVDWTGHNNQIGRMIEEQTDFIRAVETVVAWIDENGGWEENLLIITADHECGYLTAKGNLKDMKKNLIVKPSPKGTVPEVIWRSGSHTNSLVPLFAAGKGCQLIREAIDGTDPVFGEYIDNTDIGKFMIEWARANR